MTIEETVARIAELQEREKAALKSGDLRDLELIRDELYALERRLEWD